MRTLAAIATLCAVALLAPGAGADDGTPGQKAARHFQRGVTLYGEADYRAALVEFRRAYALSPNPAVLYNVGETQYQLQDYAGALTTFEHFLAEAAPGDGHRAEVEGDLEVLHSRVGHVSVTSIPPGAEITVDDQPAGKTPLERALLVSIGRRKVVATLGGRPPVTRYVDVAADDTLQVTLQLADSPESSPAPVLRADSPRPLVAMEIPHGGSTLRWLGWTSTGVLAVGAVTFGALALHESHQLAAARATFPATSQTLNRDAQLTATYSIIADSLGATAILAGSATLLSAWLSGSAAAPGRGSTGATHIVLGPASAGLVTIF